MGNHFLRENIHIKFASRLCYDTVVYAVHRHRQRILYLDAQLFVPYHSSVLFREINAQYSIMYCTAHKSRACVRTRIVVNEVSFFFFFYEWYKLTIRVYHLIITVARKDLRLFVGDASFFYDIRELCLSFFMGYKAFGNERAKLCCISFPIMGLIFHSSTHRIHKWKFESELLCGIRKKIKI